MGSALLRAKSQGRSSKRRSHPIFVGHLAVALGSKSVDKQVPLAAAVAAAFALDLIWPVLLLLGVEEVRINPGDTAFTALAFDSYPWSHSLLLVLGWSLVAAFVARRFLGTWRAAAVIGVLVLSHWVLDFVTHRPDLPIWPGGPLAGLGLWNSVPGTIVVETGLLAAGLSLHASATKPRDRTGRWSLVGLVALTSLIWVTQPWAPLPPSSDAVAWGALILWLLPPWAVWVEKHRTATQGLRRGHRESGVRHAEPEGSGH